MRAPLFYLAIFLLPFRAIADDGIWIPEDSFAQVNVFCTRVYKCVPAIDVLHGSDIKRAVHTS